MGRELGSGLREGVQGVGEQKCGTAVRGGGGGDSDLCV